VGGLVVGDLLQVVEEGVYESGLDEVGLSVVDEAFTVEFVLEVLESESIVENADFKTSGKRKTTWKGNHTISNTARLAIGN
jgi:hypothetical protein